ncbi:CoA transferase [Rhodococcoides fascians]|uniref:CaiB/BaiF CoA transferase family protein n=1 Tax=Rhodococcoides fascians TaxID=1828 RepID=UPI000B9BE71E|nr:MULTISPECIES: CaiB/BaiF CoA-transferase family protein [Rhodococcus]OZD68969.1 CoA transferase [Rhodococcus sp. 06-1059B-a]OZE81349.1 CoA transferase [Rhodococcus fascians]OZF10173.1 CoA transferase [Rhodococcus fascians]OZF13264.1 CoA transferase [Rhodococcus fascians]OZF59361.1 CoA transferase [Rhodococcus fascians]
MTDDGLPLSGVRVLDLSALLPGPLATLLLAEAGAEVVRVEKPGCGDEMRSYTPRHGEASANYAILNRGKRAYGVDLKDPVQRAQVVDAAAEADVVVEQFRPGVADRLGVGYDAITARNPRIVYCSITGYGPTGHYASRAGHDLNFMAASGLLNAVTDNTGTPSLPVSVFADISAGSYPAVVNILLALRRVERTGEGCHLHVSMTHNLQVFGYGYFSTYQVGGSWPRPGAEQLTGGSPRYRLYRTADGRHVACAALEDKFWKRLVEVVDLDPRFHDDAGQEQAVIAALSAVFLARDGAHWDALLSGVDTCTSIVATWEEAVELGFLVVDGRDRVSQPGRLDRSIPALSMPLDPAVRRSGDTVEYPTLATFENGFDWSARRR